MLFRSDAAALLRPAAVVRHRRLASRAGALDADVEGLDALVLRGTTGRLGRHLGRERRRLARALEALAAARRPGQRAALTVGDGDDRVVEGGVNVGDAVGDVLADLLAHALRGGTDGRLGHERSFST